MRLNKSVIYFAQKTGKPVMGFTYSSEGAWIAKRSWDAMLIPKLFARGAVAGTRPLFVPPGATEEEIEHLEKNIKAMPSVTTMLEEGKSVRDMLELALAGFAPDILDSYHVTYKCDCGLERVEKMIRSLGKKEVERMRDEDPVAEVNCQFCNKNYKVDLNELLKNWPSTAENELGKNA